MRRLLVALVLLTLLGGGAAATWASRLLRPAAESGEETLFAVESGDSLRAVARKLEAAGLVRDARAVVWLARLRGLDRKIRRGEYRISPTEPAADILGRIVRGEVATYQVVVPEGWTARQIGERLVGNDLVDAASFAAAVRDPDLATELGIPAATLEGYLYPETYRLPRGLAGNEVARILVAQFKHAWREVEADARARGLTMHEVVILASVVEKETGAAEERPVIASVFVNRLERGMRLESDPTIIYGIPDFDGNLRRRDLQNASNPYNTYQHKGLPPGPIASPGLDSLRAVVAPAETDYLFFVSRNDGTHYFSTSYREHEKAVDRYQRRRRSR